MCDVERLFTEEWNIVSKQREQPDHMTVDGIAELDAAMEPHPVDEVLAKVAKVKFAKIEMFDELVDELCQCIMYGEMLPEIEQVARLKVKRARAIQRGELP